MNDLESAVQVITIIGGVIALLLASLQIVETYLDISKKLRERRQFRKSKRSQASQASQER